MSIVTTAHGYFADPTIGRPIPSADIYVGEPDLDPEVVINQKQMSVQQEDGTEVNVSQPLNTSAGGVPQYLGSPVTILVKGNYSLKVNNASGSQVYYVPSAGDADTTINLLDYGGAGDDSTNNDAAIAAALVAAGSSGLIYAPTGVYRYSVEIEIPAGVSFVGDGIDITEFKKTADVIGITFQGNELDGISFTTTAAGANDGIVISGTSRHYIGKIHSEGHGGNGVVYSEGNISNFEYVKSVSNTGHGLLCDNTTANSNASTVGAMDLRGNGGDGLHITSATTPNVCQQLHGGQIVCQSNTGNAATINGRGHSLTIYDESNGGNVILDTNSEGCEIVVPFGGATDNGANNDVILGRVGSVETWQHQNLQALLLEVNDHALTGRLNITQTDNLEFSSTVAGTTSSVDMKWVHPTSAKAINTFFNGATTIHQDSGGFVNKFRVASATMSGASTAIQVNVATGERILGVQLRVDVLVTSGDGATSWDAAYSGGATQAITTGRAFAQNTKVNKQYDANADSDLSSGGTDITITPDSGTFSGGEISAFVYVQAFKDLEDAP